MAIYVKDKMCIVSLTPSNQKIFSDSTSLVFESIFLKVLRKSLPEKIYKYVVSSSSFFPILYIVIMPSG